MSSMTFAPQNGFSPNGKNGSQAYTNGHGSGSAWGTLTVQQFFRAVNWEDNPPEVQEMKMTASAQEGASLSLVLTVGQFFSAVNWDGSAIAAAPTPSVEPTDSESPATNFTLEDFSELF
jgi:hypothetical protein